MLKIYRLYTLFQLQTSVTTWVEDFDARNSDAASESEKNAQAERDMFHFMEVNPGHYTFTVIYVSE